VIDPATADVVISLLVGSGVAIGVVLLLLGVRRLLRPRVRPVAGPAPIEEPGLPVERTDEPVAEEQVEEPVEQPVAVAEVAPEIAETAAVPEPRTSREDLAEESALQR
jgi:hypothetical protein